MHILRSINSFLANFNIVIAKRSTVDDLHNKVHELQQNSQSSDFEVMSNEFNSVAQILGNLKTELLQHQIATHWCTIDYIEKQSVKLKIKRECPLCNYQDDDEAFKKFNSHCIFGGGNLERHQCPKCDLIFGADKMMALTDKELSQDYLWHYKVYEEGDSTAQEIRAFKALNPNKKGLYLNYGAGVWSRSIQILRSEGWNVYGFEPYSSDDNEYIITSYETLYRMKFDGIFSNDVLEHFKTPIEELEKMSHLLHDGGLMSHATPCFEYLFEYTRFHLFFFLGRSREVLADKSGLCITDYQRDGNFMNIILKAKQ